MDQNAVYTAHSKVESGNLDFRFGKEDDVLNARERFFDDVGIESKQIAEMDVLHSDALQVVTRSHSICYTTDALITNLKDVALFLLTADCFPISFYDPENKVIALAHLGWRPTSLKLSQKVVRKMTEKFNTRPEELIVSIGPGIHKDSYIKNEPAQKDDPRWSPYIEDIGDGNYLIDLLNFNIDQLTDAGVMRDSIEVSESDTAKDTEYFSHYRAKLLDEVEGRFATILSLK